MSDESQGAPSVAELDPLFERLRRLELDARALTGALADVGRALFEASVPEQAWAPIADVALRYARGDATVDAVDAQLPELEAHRRLGRGGTHFGEQVCREAWARMRRSMPELTLTSMWPPALWSWRRSLDPLASARVRIGDAAQALSYAERAHALAALERARETGEMLMKQCAPAAFAVWRQNDVGMRLEVNEASQRQLRARVSDALAAWAG